MQYIVMDLEWNQSPKGRPMQDRGLTFEIIEIGALKLNEKMEIIGEFQELVKPQLYPKIHEIIQEMVRIAPEELAAARTFPPPAALISSRAIFTDSTSAKPYAAKSPVEVEISPTSTSSAANAGNANIATATTIDRNFFTLAPPFLNIKFVT